MWCWPSLLLFCHSLNENQAYEVLRGLSKTERFQVTVMLLSKKDKGRIESMFGRLKPKHLELRDYESISQAYGV